MKQNTIQNALKSLRLVKADLEKQLNDVRNAIYSLSGGGSIDDDVKPEKYVEYDSNWGLANKFLFLLKIENRFLHFREAAEIICQIEGKGDPKELAGKISSGAQSLKGTKIVKYQASKSNQDTFWGSPKWLDADGKITSGHEYNMKYFHSREEKIIPLFDI